MWALSNVWCTRMDIAAYLLLFEQCTKLTSQFIGTFSIHTKRLFNNETIDTISRVNRLLDTFGYWNKHRWRKCHIKDTVTMSLRNTTLLFILDKIVVKRLPGRVIIIQSRVISGDSLELFQFLFISLDILSHTAKIVFMSHLGTSIANNVCVFRQESIAEKLEKSGICLLLCKVTRSTQYYCISTMSVTNMEWQWAFSLLVLGSRDRCHNKTNASLGKEREICWRDGITDDGDKAREFFRDLCLDFLCRSRHL